MEDLPKGYIRWWKHRVMDYEGDNEGKWENPNPRPDPWTWEKHQEWSKGNVFIPFPYEDKPIADLFKAKMSLVGFYRGRSAAGFTFKDEEGREHTMRIKCVTELLLNADINKGVVCGSWRYVKQGANFSLKYMGPIS
jgi:hypothetical protein